MPCRSLAQSDLCGNIIFWASNVRISCVRPNWGLSKSGLQQPPPRRSANHFQRTGKMAKNAANIATQKCPNCWRYLLMDWAASKMQQRGVAVAIFSTKAEFCLQPSRSVFTTWTFQSLFNNYIILPVLQLQYLHWCPLTKVVKTGAYQPETWEVVKIKNFRAIPPVGIKMD